MKGRSLLRLILDAFDEGVCVLNAAGNVRYMNSAAEELTGYREQDLIGRPFLPNVKILLDSGDPDSDAHAAFERRPAKSSIGVQFQRNNGEVLDVICTNRPLGQDGVGPTLLKFRKREPLQHPALQDIKSKLAAIFNTIPDGLIVISDVGDIQLFSSGAEKLFGYRQDEALGQNVRMLMPSPFHEAHDGYLSTYRNAGVKKIIGIGRDVSGRRKDGTVFPMYISIGEIWLDGRRYFVGVTHDLSRLKQAEERLLTLSAAMDQSPSAVMISDKEGRIEYVNRCFTRLTGYDAAELIGHNPRLLRSHETSPDQHRHLWETLQAGLEWRGEIQDRTKSGAVYWALETVTPLHDAQGEITHYLAIQEDITEQKQNKEALAESEERFRQVAEMAGEWLWEQDPQGIYIYCSDAVQSILGFAPGEILGKCYLDLLTERNRDYWINTPPHLSAVSRQSFHHLVNQYRHKDGREVFTESTGAPILDEQGRLVKWRGVDHDITARKAFEDALRVRNRAIESVHVGIVISDAQAPGNPNIYVNPALCAITGYSREELLGRNMHLLQGPETDPAIVLQMRQALESGQACEVTLRNYRKGGAAFWNELLISPVVDDTGKLTHYIGVQTDVTERRKAEESRRELEIARQIQLSLLPGAPLRLPHAEIAGLCVPANHVGGDYFDYFRNSDAIDLVIADVSGHSVGAALIMTEVRSTLRAEARNKMVTPVGPAQVLRDLNELLYDDLNKAELFITMFHLKFLPESRTLKYANAGHNWALLLRSGTLSCSPLDADGLIIGVLPAADFEERSIELSVGDKLLLYTDGITEAENQQREFFGIDRLCALFTAHRGLTPEALVKQLLADVRTFCGAEPLRDDIALVIMQVC
jgi:sigma-B regulation protein RsbU (phosphoserine phosphatase)